jgi:hypothetical protein
MKRGQQPTMSLSLLNGEEWWCRKWQVMKSEKSNLLVFHPAGGRFIATTVSADTFRTIISQQLT